MPPTPDAGPWNAPPETRSPREQFEAWANAPDISASQREQRRDLLNSISYDANGAPTLHLQYRLVPDFVSLGLPNVPLNLHGDVVLYQHTRLPAGCEIYGNVTLTMNSGLPGGTTVHGDVICRHPDVTIGQHVTVTGKLDLPLVGGVMLPEHLSVKALNVSRQANLVLPNHLKVDDLWMEKSSVVLGHDMQIASFSAKDCHLEGDITGLGASRFTLDTADIHRVSKEHWDAGKVRVSGIPLSAEILKKVDYTLVGAAPDTPVQALSLIRKAVRKRCSSAAIALVNRLLAHKKRHEIDTILAYLNEEQPSPDLLKALRTGTIEDAVAYVELAAVQKALEQLPEESIPTTLSGRLEQTMDDWSKQPSRSEAKEVLREVRNFALNHCAGRAPNDPIPAWLTATDDQTTLERLARRILTLVTERQNNVFSTLGSVLSELLSSSDADRDQALAALNAHADRLPGNEEIRQGLQKAGYALSHADVEIPLTLSALATDPRASLRAARQHAGEYLDLLSEAQANQVDVEGIPVDAHTLFDTDDAATFRKRLDATRGLLTRLFDGNPAKRSRIDAISTQAIRSLEMKPTGPQRSARATPLTVCYHRDVWSTLGCCPPGIPGCYAPDGAHAERPIEIALRRDQTFLSIYNQRGKEVESLEAELHPAGLVVVTPYHREHGLATGLAWAYTFRQLLADNVVPAIIVPSGPAFGGVRGNALTAFYGEHLPEVALATFDIHRDSHVLFTSKPDYEDGFKATGYVLTKENTANIPIPDVSRPVARRSPEGPRDDAAKAYKVFTNDLRRRKKGFYLAVLGPALHEAFKSAWISPERRVSTEARAALATAITKAPKPKRGQQALDADAVAEDLDAWLRTHDAAKAERTDRPG